MEYEKIEVQKTGVIVSDELIAEEQNAAPLIPVSSSYEYREGADDSPYIITSSTY
jgi:hypothetical protein